MCVSYSYSFKFLPYFEDWYGGNIFNIKNYAPNIAVWHRLYMAS